MAHGDYQRCMAILNCAYPLLKMGKYAVHVENYFMTEVECLYALHLKKQALGLARKQLKQHPRFQFLRMSLEQIESETLPIKPWAPKSASYLRKLQDFTKPPTARRK